MSLCVHCGERLHASLLHYTQVTGYTQGKMQQSSIPFCQTAQYAGHADRQVSCCRLAGELTILCCCDGGRGEFAPGHTHGRSPTPPQGECFPQNIPHRVFTNQPTKLFQNTIRPNQIYKRNFSFQIFPTKILQLKIRTEIFPTKKFPKEVRNEDTRHNHPVFQETVRQDM